MKRIALILALLAVVAAYFVAGAGASGSHTYQAELFNAFGLVKGSELRVAGAKAGTITGLDITPQKTALVTFEVDSGFPEFKADASCSSEPQSLIAEYFLDCEPGNSPQPLTGPIPAARNKTTVQPDLAQNTLREPFKDRLQLLINEFGTALDGNAENLNAAIRSGAPALQQLKQVLNILGRQNHTIAELNTNADTIFPQLANRREDVVHFIDNAGRTAAISAERSNDLSQNFHLLDDFLAQLKPTMVQLGNLAEQQTPLLTDLHAAAPGLNKLAKNLPRSTTAPSSPSPPSAARRTSARWPSPTAMTRSPHSTRPAPRPIPPPTRSPSSSRASPTPRTPSRRTPAPATTSASSPGRPTGGFSSSTRS